MKNFNHEQNQHEQILYFVLMRDLNCLSAQISNFENCVNRQFQNNVSHKDATAADAEKTRRILPQTRQMKGINTAGLRQHSCRTQRPAPQLTFALPAIHSVPFSRIYYGFLVPVTHALHAISCFRKNPAFRCDDYQVASVEW